MNQRKTSVRHGLRHGHRYDNRAPTVHRGVRLEAHYNSVEAEGTARMKRAIQYMRVLTVDQHPETQLHDLRQIAKCHRISTATVERVLHECLAQPLDKIA